MEIVIENPTSDVSSTSVTSSATNLETAMRTTSPVNPIFATLPSHNRPYRTAYVTNDGLLAQNVDYYRTLQSQTSRTRHVSPEPIYDANVPIQTSVRRVDRSGLLEIAEPEPQRISTRNRHPTSIDTTGTLSRRIDRSGLLEAVPEVPDQSQHWRTENSSKLIGVPTSSDESRERSIADRKLTGAESNDPRDDNQRQNVNIRRLQSSPRNLSVRRSSTDITSSQEDNDLRERFLENHTSATSPTVVNNGSTTSNVTSLSSTSISSPYLRRYPSEGPTLNLERPTPVIVTDDKRTRGRNSFACVSPNANKFLPIDALPARSRQSYVDLTGATYTRSSLSPMATSPNGGTTRTSAESTQTNFSEIESSKRPQQQPDCLGRSSPRSRCERQSPLTMSSSIPDVIEAHGSRSHNRETVNEKAPDGERVEAEGCEHTNVDNTEETRISFKSTNKILHNDNIQTLRVIILSEQL